MISEGGTSIEFSLRLVHDSLLSFEVPIRLGVGAEVLDEPIDGFGR